VGDGCERSWIDSTSDFFECTYDLKRLIGIVRINCVGGPRLVMLDVMKRFKYGKDKLSRFHKAYSSRFSHSIVTKK
jgi:hypothetical protein